MSFLKKYWISILVGAGLALFGFFGFSRGVKAPVPPSPRPVATSTPSVVSTTTTPASQPTAVSTSSAIKSFPINTADKVKIGDFKGSYTGSETLIKQANADIKNLTSLLGKKKYDDYSLYNGIANDYSSLGKGELAYKNYNRSIRIHPNKGLAYVNLAHLMDQLGAYYTAADAYAKAVHVEPSVVDYHVARLTFLTRQFPKDTVQIKAALADSNKQFGDIAQVVMVEAQWLSSEGRYADAIAAWKRVKLISPGRDMTAVNAEIARLQNKLSASQ